jgi:hypothetical protein
LVGMAAFLMFYYGNNFVMKILMLYIILNEWSKLRIQGCGIWRRIHTIVSSIYLLIIKQGCLQFGAGNRCNILLILAI